MDKDPRRELAARYTLPLVVKRTRGPTGGGNVYYWVEDADEEVVIRTGTDELLARFIVEMAGGAT